MDPVTLTIIINVGASVLSGLTSFGVYLKHRMEHKKKLKALNAKIDEHATEINLLKASSVNEPIETPSEDRYAKPKSNFRTL